MLDTEYSRGSRPSSPLNFLYPIMPSSSSSPTRPSFLNLNHTHGSSSSSLTTTAPHSHSLSSSHHTPGGKRHARRKEREQQEIARLLDPSYQGHAGGAAGEGQHHAGGRPSLEVYVDQNGDLHDPDFRYFPSAETFVSRTRRDAERDRRMRRRMRTTSPTGIRRRPYWDHQQVLEESALTDDDERMEEEEEMEMYAMELGVNDFLERAGYGNGYLTAEYSTLSKSRKVARREGSFGGYAAAGYGGYAGYGSASTTATTTSTAITTGTATTANTTSYYSPTMTTTTLPTSYESDNTVLSSSAEGAAVDGEREAGVGVKSLLAAAKRRRRSSKGEKERKDDGKDGRRSVDGNRTSVLETTREEGVFETHVQHDPLPCSYIPPAEDEEEDRGEAKDTEDPEFIQSHQEHVPTCSDILKRHWLSMSLRVRFGVYRAQKRLVDRVNSKF